MWGRRTSGTTSANQGRSLNSSANQFAVAEPRSFARLYISHGWKWTPASGWFRARFSSGAQVLRSHSAGGVLRIDTLFRDQETSTMSVELILEQGTRGSGYRICKEPLVRTAYNLPRPKARRIRYHSRRACAWRQRRCDTSGPERGGGLLLSLQRLRWKFVLSAQFHRVRRS
jgi:hypothetical protein